MVAAATVVQLADLAVATAVALLASVLGPCRPPRSCVCVCSCSLPSWSRFVAVLAAALVALLGGGRWSRALRWPGVAAIVASGAISGVPVGVTLAGAECGLVPWGLWHWPPWRFPSGLSATKTSLGWA